MTLIGIMADSHGRAAITRAAVKALIERGCGLLIHLGDLCSEQVIDELVGHNTRIVLGNCDEQALARYAEHVGIACDHPAGRLEIDGKTLAYTHGHMDLEMRAALDEGVDYLVHGHTHELRDERVGRTRVINPGALCRAARYTAAVLSPAGDELNIVTLPTEESSVRS